MRFKEYIKYEHDDELILPHWLNKREVSLKKDNEYTFEILFASLIYSLHPNYYENMEDYEKSKPAADSRFLYYYDKLSKSDKQLIAIQMFKVAKFQLPEYLFISNHLRAGNLTERMYSQYFSFFPDFSEDVNYFSTAFSGFASYRVFKDFKVLTDRLLILDKQNVYSNLVHYNDPSKSNYDKHLNGEMLEFNVGLLTENSKILLDFANYFEVQNSELVNQLKKDLRKNIELEFKNIEVAFNSKQRFMQPFNEGIEHMFKSLTAEDLKDKSLTIWDLVQKDFNENDNLNLSVLSQNLMLCINHLYQIDGQVAKAREMEKECFEKKGDFLYLNIVKFTKLCSIYRLPNNRSLNFLTENKNKENVKTFEVFDYYKEYETRRLSLDFSELKKIAISLKELYSNTLQKISGCGNKVKEHFFNSWENTAADVLAKFIEIERRDFIKTEIAVEGYMGREFNIYEPSLTNPDEVIKKIESKYPTNVEDLPSAISFCWKVPDDKDLIELYSHLFFKALNGNKNIEELAVLFERNKMKEVVQKAVKPSYKTRKF